MKSLYVVCGLGSSRSAHMDPLLVQFTSNWDPLLIHHFHTVGFLFILVNNINNREGGLLIGSRKSSNSYQLKMK